MGTHMYVPLTIVFSGGMWGNLGTFSRKPPSPCTYCFFRRYQESPGAALHPGSTPKWHMTVTASLQLFTQVPEREAIKCATNTHAQWPHRLSPLVTTNAEGGEALHSMWNVELDV